MLSLTLTIERQQAEWEMILTIAGNNNFLTKLITNLKTQNPRDNSERKE